MLDQNSSDQNFNILEDDSHLENLFERLDQRQQFLFNFIPDQLQTQFDFSFNSKDLEKGYESQTHNPNRQHRKIKKKYQVLNKEETSIKKKRTKIYIQSLENKIEELQKEIDKQRKLNKINREYIKKLNQSEQIINGFFIDRQKIFEKLQKITEADSIDVHKIIDQYECLKYKQGAYGKERIKAINYYFKEMVEMFMPDPQKYLAQAAEHQTDVFDPLFLQIEIDESWRKEMIQKLNLSQTEIHAFCSYREEIIEKKQIFNTQIRQLYEMKCGLIKQSRQLEIIFEKFNSFLSPTQVGRFLIYIEKYKFKKGISIEGSISEIYKAMETNQEIGYMTSSNLKDFQDKKANPFQF